MVQEEKREMAFLVAMAAAAAVVKIRVVHLELRLLKAAVLQVQKDPMEVEEGQLLNLILMAQVVQEVGVIMMTLMVVDNTVVAAADLSGAKLVVVATAMCVSR